ncbi:hypothetical protein HUJ04_009884 [Dendroctonus ponderosae]|nr:hypothetical protein HUJ04_009884 [Dendroctonus ponderosae]
MILKVSKENIMLHVDHVINDNRPYLAISQGRQAKRRTNKRLFAVIYFDKTTKASRCYPESLHSAHSSNLALHQPIGTPRAVSTEDITRCPNRSGLFFIVCQENVFPRGE